MKNLVPVGHAVMRARSDGSLSNSSRPLIAIIDIFLLYVVALVYRCIVLSDLSISASQVNRRRMFPNDFSMVSASFIWILESFRIGVMMYVASLFYDFPKNLACCFTVVFG